MALDRYNRPFLLPEHLHREGLPFEIEAGALLIDTTNDNALAQLKMASHADQNVKAVKVTLQPEDTRGEALGDAITHQYLDLDVSRVESFGQKTPIPLPDQSSRSFSILDVEVVYADNSVASSDGGPWSQIPDQEPLRATISDEELVKQYQIDFGEGCIYRLQELGDLWRCVCGATNRSDEDACHECGQQLATLRGINPSEVESRKRARLEEERAAREAALEKERIEKEEAEKAVAEARKKTRKTAIIVGGIAAALAVAFFVANATIIPQGKYNDAQALMDSGDYAGAKTAFEELGDYQDSQTKVTECKEAISQSVREEIVTHIQAGEYKEAVSAAKDSDIEDADAIYAEAEREVIRNAEVGDVVVYGKSDPYEGNEDGDPVQWLVLDKDENSALLLNRFVGYMHSYNDSDNTAYNDNWSNSELRELQNSETYLKHFTSDELKCIPKREHVYDGSRTCEDRFFFLTRADVEKYLPDPSSRIAYGNDNGTVKAVTWWLSEVARRQKSEGGWVQFYTVEYKDGSFGFWGEAAEVGGRPAMWVNFE